jgi:ATP-dependent protease ClpP protease subunit
LEDKNEEELKHKVQERAGEENSELVMAKLYIREFDEAMISETIALSLIEGKKEIYLCSPGGLASAATILIDLINEDPDNYTIKVSEQVASAALLTILNVKCKVVDIASNMSFFTAYMAHDASVAGRVNKHIRKLGRKANRDMFEVIRPVLTTKQVNYYERCQKLFKILPFIRNFIYEDLYLSREQIKMLLGDRYEIRER